MPSTANPSTTLGLTLNLPACPSTPSPAMVRAAAAMKASVKPASNVSDKALMPSSKRTRCRLRNGRRQTTQLGPGLRIGPSCRPRAEPVRLRHVIVVVGTWHCGCGHVALRLRQRIRRSASALRATRRGRLGVPRAATRDRRAGSPVGLTLCKHVAYVRERVDPHRSAVGLQPGRVGPFGFGFGLGFALAAGLQRERVCPDGAYPLRGCDRREEHKHHQE